MSDITHDSRFLHASLATKKAFFMQASEIILDELRISNPQHRKLSRDKFSNLTETNWKIAHRNGMMIPFAKATYHYRSNTVSGTGQDIDINDRLATLFREVF